MERCKSYVNQNASHLFRKYFYKKCFYQEIENVQHSYSGFISQLDDHSLRRFQFTGKLEIIHSPGRLFLFQLRNVLLIGNVKCTSHTITIKMEYEF